VGLPFAFAVDCIGRSYPTSGGIVYAPRRRRLFGGARVTFTRFESLGVYLPSRVETTPQLVDRMVYKPPFDLQSITGIRERRLHAAGEDSVALACAAARDCLSRSRYRPADLDLVVSVSITRKSGPSEYDFEPSFALHVKRALGATAAAHFDVSNACAGMMTGVYLLDRLIRAGQIRRGMVVSGECISGIGDTAAAEVTDARDPQFASLTVGDSGAAVVVDRSEDEADRIHYVDLMTAAAYSRLCLGMPSDRRAGIALYTDNREMHRPERVPLWTRFHEDLLARRGTSVAAERYDHVVHHQVGMTAVRLFHKFAGTHLGVPLPEQLTCLEEFGNTSTTSHFLVLHKHLRAGTIRPGARLLMVPAASGLVVGSVAATITSLKV
jgi:3-oxoacyl-[acyl-carrier-protein] synthase-3